MSPGHHHATGARWSRLSTIRGIDPMAACINLLPAFGRTRFAVAATAAVLAGPAVAALDAADDADRIEAIATARLDAIRADLAGTNELDVMVSASVHADDGSLTAPPRRSSFAFSRPTGDRPFRFSVHSWSGPGGGSDLVCDGTGLVVGDPLLRRYEMRPAPVSAGEVLADGDLAPRLGVGPSFMLAALAEGLLDDLVIIDEIVPCTLNGREALTTRCRTAADPAGRTLELTFTREGAPALLGVTMAAGHDHTLVLVFKDWRRDATRDRIDGRDRFAMTPPSGWEPTSSLRAEAADGANSAPVRSLVGRRAPRLPMRDAGGEETDPFDGMAVPVAILFTGDDALNDRAARDFETVIEGDTRLRGYRVRLVDDASEGPGADRDLAVDAARSAAAWRLSGLPTLVIVTPDGRIRAAQVGHPGRDAWTRRLDPLLDRLATVPTTADRGPASP